MIPPEYVRAVESERTRQAARSRMERLAICARACGSASNTLISRLGRVMRRSDSPC